MLRMRQTMKRHLKLDISSLWSTKVNHVIQFTGIHINQKRANRHVLESKVMAFADAYDMSFILKHYIEKSLGTQPQLQMITDSKS